jgi:hypothetical protein
LIIAATAGAAYVAGLHERSEGPPHADREPADDPASGTLSSEMASLTPPIDPTELATVPSGGVLAEFDTATNARYRLLNPAEDHFPVTALPTPATVPDRRKRDVLAAAIVFLVLAGTGAYLYVTASRSFLDAPPSRDASSGAAGMAGNPLLVAPTTGPDPSSQAEAARSAALAETTEATARAVAATPGAPSDVQAAPRAATVPINPVDGLTRSAAVPVPRTAALTDAQRSTTQGTKRTANAAGTVPRPDRLAPTGRTTEQFGPCTATVAALGLCTPTPIQSKE